MHLSEAVKGYMIIFSKEAKYWFSIKAKEVSPTYVHSPEIFHRCKNSKYSQRLHVDVIYTTTAFAYISSTHLKKKECQSMAGLNLTTMATG